MSTKTKHTAGPWQVDETWNLITADCGMIEVAACHSGERIAPKRNSKGTATANARLISAAPDLLSAAKRALKTIEDLPLRYNEDHYDPLIAITLAALTLAIIKAEGKPV